MPSPRSGSYVAATTASTILECHDGSICEHIIGLSLSHQVSAQLDSFIQTIHHNDFPKSIEATQKLSLWKLDYARLKEQISAPAKNGEILLNIFKSNDEVKEY
uniref:Uncharacterized protein n=1 Tax=Glossina pallidipes TaxID=7398 RepID=A0A1B0A654_GLOPL